MINKKTVKRSVEFEKKSKVAAIPKDATIPKDAIIPTNSVPKEGTVKRPRLRFPKFRFTGLPLPKIHQSKIPSWLAIVVGIPVLVSLVWVGFQLYQYFSVQGYPDETIEFTEYASLVDPYASPVDPSSFTYTDYTLPLTRLPTNYETVRDALSVQLDHEDLVLLLRNGFVQVPTSDASVSAADQYQDLAQLHQPLVITSDAVLVYANSVFNETRNEANEYIVESFGTYLEQLSADALSRSRARDIHVQEGYLMLAVRFSTARRLLAQDTEIQENVNEEVDQQVRDFQDTADWNADDPLLSALKYLTSAQCDESEENLRAEILSARLMKGSYLQSDWSKLASYFDFFYTDYSVLDIEEVDDVVASTVGYGADDTEIIGDEVVDALRKEHAGCASEELSGEELSDEEESGEEQSDEEPSIEEQSVEEQSSDTDTPEIISLAARFGIQTACEQIGREPELCGLPDSESEEVRKEPILREWIVEGDETEQMNYNFTQSIDWVKKMNSLALWFADTSISFEKNDHTNDTDAFELPEDSTVFLEPNPEMYQRIAYTAELINAGLESSDTLSSESQSALDELASTTSTLADISAHIRTGTALEPDDTEFLRDALSGIIMKAGDNYETADTQLLLVSVKDSEGNLAIAIGPSFRFQPSENYLSELTDEGKGQLQSVLDSLTITAESNNFNEPYDMPVVAQKAGTVRIPVLMYHQITVSPTTSLTRRLYVPPEIFEEQLAYLASKNYHTLTPQEFYDILATGQNPPQKSIMLTFDDSVSNHYTAAFPLLKKYGFTGVFYIVSQHSGITAAQMKEMSDAGMIIDSHSVTHRDLRIIDDAALVDEISGSKAALQSITGKTVLSMCYPGCTVDDRGINITASSGYILGFSCGSSIDHSFRNRYVLSRIHVYDDMDNFRKIMSGIWEIPASYYQ